MRKRRKGVIERMFHGLFDAVEHAVYAEGMAKTGGLLQRIDPRVKVVGCLALIVAAVQSRNIMVVSAVFALAVALALMSKVSLRTLATRVWIGVLLFTGAIAIPAIFIVPGDVLYRLPFLDLPIMAQGLKSAAFLIARAETSATLCLLLILSTPWTHVLKALRVFRIPVVFVVILGMTHRYTFLLLQTASDMFESRRSRMVGSLNVAERRRLAIASAGVLMTKSFQLSNEVYLAMRSRGYRGEVYTLDDFTMKPLDWIMLIVFIALTTLAFWLG